MEDTKEKIVHDGLEYLASIESSWRQMAVTLDIANLEPYPRIKAYKLINSFSFHPFVSRYEGGYFNIPQPFIALYSKLYEFAEDELYGFVDEANLWDYYPGSDQPESVLLSIFWRLYGKYRFGVNPNVKLQIEQLSPASKKFFDKNLPILNRKLAKYIIINKYIVMPLQRFWINVIKKEKVKIL